MMWLTLWNNKFFFDEDSKNIIVNWKKIIPSVRTYSQMRDLYFQKDDTIPSDFWLYYMFRWFYLSDEDKLKFDENGLKYDITVLVSQIIWNRV